MKRQFQLVEKIFLYLRNLNSKLLFKTSNLGMYSVLLFLVFLSCSSPTNEPQISEAFNSIINAVQVKNQSINQYIEKELPVYNQLTEQIYLLDALKQSPTNSFILFVPSEDLLKSALTEYTFEQRQVLVKKSVVLHNNRTGEWNKKGTSYGGVAIELSADETRLNFNGQSARVLRKVDFKDGYLIYVIDNIIT